MPMAFVMINTELGSEKEVLDEIRKIKQVKESCIVYGIHDIAVKIGADTIEKIDEIVTRIRNLKKIQDTVTLFLIEDEK
jgi:DNA-binding Lrp family transcriptional regulator